MNRPSELALDLPPSTPPAPLGRLLQARAEAGAFWHMRLRLVRTLVRQTFAGARFRLALILLLMGLLWFGLFAMFHEGFVFVRSTLPRDLHDPTMRVIFGMFFVTLMTMLAFSSGIILFGSLFRNREVAFLLTLPTRIERIFLHKFQEAVFLASWGFLLLGSPMLLAYGLVAHSPWYYFVMLVPFLVAFSVIPVGFGAIVCLVIVRHLPSRRGWLAASLFAGGVTLLLWVGWPLITGFQRDLLTPDWFLSVLDRLRFTEHRWLPSWWLSSGLLDAAEGEGAESVLFLALLISNALFFQQLAMWISGAMLRSAYSALQGRSSGRRRARVAWLDRVVLWLTAPLPAATRLLIIKDVRLFRRDPVQWSQILIFFGLLGLYLLNVRRFSYDSSYAGWVNMLSFLNVAVVGLLLSSFTTRFIFPMISLEGSRFWILGLLPLRRETILWSKFLFSAGGATIPCAGLILLSDLLFGVGLLLVSVHQVACLLLCLGLSGIAVGLGAKLPSLREQSPSRIAAGFGGTVNLIVSTVYIVLVVVLMVLPYHLHVGDYAHRDFGLYSSRDFLGRWLDLWLVGGTASSVLLSLLATVVPLRVGFRAIRELEF